MQSKQSQWSAHVQGWQASGVSQAGYCRTHGLSLASFGYWRRKLAGEAPPVPAALLPIYVAPAVQDARVAAMEAQLTAIQAEGEDPATAQARRKAASTGRKPLPEHLERIQTRHEPKTCTCPQCQADLVLIGEHVSERLACKPLAFYVKQDIYPQYACRACEQVVAEPVAPAIIERGQADSSLLAQVAIAKYVDHLPLYRQEAIYARSGVALSRTTLAEWIGAVGVALQPLAERLGEQLRQQPVLHADETPVALLDPKAGKTQRAYLFAYSNAQHVGAAPPRVVFQFQTSRSGQHARDFLGEWRGR
jgi:transposase